VCWVCVGWRGGGGGWGCERVGGNACGALGLFGAWLWEQKEAGDAGDWLAGKRKEQEGRGATEGPAVTAREIRAKRDALQVCWTPYACVLEGDGESE
jgi:hypothetical protein